MSCHVLKNKYVCVPRNFLVKTFVIKERFYAHPVYLTANGLWL